MNFSRLMTKLPGFLEALIRLIILSFFRILEVLIPIGITLIVIKCASGNYTDIIKSGDFLLCSCCLCISIVVLGSDYVAKGSISKYKAKPYLKDTIDIIKIISAFIAFISLTLYVVSFYNQILIRTEGLEEIIKTIYDPSLRDKLSIPIFFSSIGLMVLITIIEYFSLSKKVDLAGESNINEMVEQLNK